MKNHWVVFKSDVALFLHTKTIHFWKVYAFAITSLMVAAVIIGGVFSVTRRGTGVVHGTSNPELLAFARELNLIALQDRRERGRLNDFTFTMIHLLENYPFLEMAERSGVDMTAVWANAMEELAEVARDDHSPYFFMDFINDNFLDHLVRYGGLTLTGAGTREAPWNMEPYFFGYHDWQFTDDRFRFNLDVAENLHTEILGDGVAYMRVDSFLAMGYYPDSGRPFWHYHLADEQQRLLEFYNEIDDFNHLIIDIRGIADGFDLYFLSLILEPNINTRHELMFYGFHMDGYFSNKVSAASREWFDLGGLQPALSLSAGLLAPPTPPEVHCE